jgi:hypothetical protein
MWRASIVLAPFAAALVWLGAPFWLGLASAIALMFAVFAKGQAARWGRVALLPVLALAAVAMVLHATARPEAPGPAVVAFTGGQYSSSASSFTVGAVNSGASAAHVHTIRVRFTNDQAPAVITDVTERAAVTVPAGQSAALTYAAPRAVVNTAAEDWEISVTVLGWS